MVLQIGMATIRRFLFLSLTLLPIFLGLASNLDHCFENDSLETISHISDFTAENTSSDCHKNNDCSDCCSLSHTVVITTEISFKMVLPTYYVHPTFHYTFNPKTIVLDTPEKPPRA